MALRAQPDDRLRSHLQLYTRIANISNTMCRLPQTLRMRAFVLDLLFLNHNRFLLCYCRCDGPLNVFLEYGLDLRWNTKATFDDCYACIQLEYAALFLNVCLAFAKSQCPPASATFELLKENGNKELLDSAEDKG